MGAFIAGTLGSAITWLGEQFAKKGVRIATSIGVVMLLLTFIPYELKLPDELIELLISDDVRNLIHAITYFYPVAFALKCLLAIFLSSHSSIIIGLLKKIYHIIVGGGTSGT